MQIYGMRNVNILYPTFRPYRRIKLYLAGGTDRACRLDPRRRRRAARSAARPPCCAFRRPCRRCYCRGPACPSSSGDPCCCFPLLLLDVKKYIILNKELNMRPIIASAAAPLRR